jgi:hypothetical protein
MMNVSANQYLELKCESNMLIQQIEKIVNRSYD